MRGIWQDVRFASRALAKRPALALFSVLSLALGIGGNLATLSVGQSLVLDPLPFEEPERLVLAFGSSSRLGQHRDVISGPNFLDLQEQSSHFQGLAAFKSGGGAVMVQDRALATEGMLVSPGFFRVLGVKAALGRTFLPQDGRTGHTDVAIISHAFWQKHLGADPGVIGRKLQMVGHSRRLIGVLPRSFRFPLASDLILPLDMGSLGRQGRMSINYWALGRLARGAGLPAAEAELNAILDQIGRLDPRIQDWDIVVEPMGQVVSESIRPAVLFLLGIAGLTLLIVCANLSGLLAARGSSRLAEMAIRSTLGATRSRLVRLLLSESLLLAVGGGLTGLLAGLWLIWWLPSLLPQTVPLAGSALQLMLPQIGLGAALPFALLLSLASALLSTVAPALQIRSGLMPRLGERGAGEVAGRGSLGMRNGMVVGQLALATLLLATTGLALASTKRLLLVDAGLEPSKVLTLYFGELDQLGSQRRSLYYRQVLQAVQNLPGVISAGLNDYVPLQQEDDFAGFHPQGRRVEGVRFREEWRRVSAGYFRAAGIELLQGREFTQADDQRASSVAIINRAMAAKYWPGQDPVGKRIVIHNRAYGNSEIVGVVGDVRRRGLDVQAPPVIYVPFHRSPRPVMALFARSRSDPGGMVAPVQEAIRSVDPWQPIERVSSLRDVISESLAVPRLVAWLAAAIGALALLVSAIGVYSAMAFDASRRRREMSIRKAVGAGRLDLLKIMLGRGLLLALCGALLGLAGSSAAERLVAGLLFEFSPPDRVAYAISMALVVGVALLACLLPALRLSRVDPVKALRG